MTDAAPVRDGPRTRSRAAKRAAEKPAEPEEPKKRVAEEPNAGQVGSAGAAAPVAKGEPAAQARQPTAPRPLSVGDALPDVTLLDQDEVPMAVAELRKVVIFTYPRVCRIEPR